MSFLNPDSIWRGGGGVDVECSSHRASCLEGNVVDLGMWLVLQFLNVLPRE